MVTPLLKYGTSDGININLLLAAQANGEVTVNTLLKLIVTFASRALVESELATAPGSPTEGDIHLLSGVGGDWSTFAVDSLAMYLDSAWYEIEPIEGLNIYLKDTNASKTWNTEIWAENPSSVTSGITANAGGTQGGAVAITRAIAEVSTVGTAGDSVKLPAAKTGLTVVVINSTATALDLFPATADAIDALAVNLAVSVPAFSVATMRAINGVTWFSQIS